MIKKILIICMIAVASTHAHATTICADDDTLIIAFDSRIGGTTHSSNTEIYEWSTTFPYGTVFGIATCVTTPSGAATDTLIDQESGEIATGGERTGQYCWCQMTHPAKSRWMFRVADSSVAVCGSACTNHCASYVRGNSSFREDIFGSLGN